MDDFNIDLTEFQNEILQLDFHLYNTFFSLKENSLFEKCDLKVSLYCTKVEATVTFNYTINGIIGTDCERCLKPKNMAIDFKSTEAYKLTGDRDLLGLENYISEANPSINIYDSLYESICTQMPNRLICENAIDGEECKINLDNNPLDNIDPRWDKLKNLIK